MKLRALDAHGFAHHLVLVVIVVGVAIGGTYMAVRSFADTTNLRGNPLYSKAVCTGSYYHRQWDTAKKMCYSPAKCQSGYTKVVSNPYDYCAKGGASAQMTDRGATSGPSVSVNPLKSSSTCQNTYHRVWSGGTCQKKCQSGYTYHIASVYDYCTKTSTSSTSSSTKSTAAQTSTKAATPSYSLKICKDIDKTCMTITSSTSNLGSFSNHFVTFNSSGGCWQLFDGTGYKTAIDTIKGKQANLASTKENKTSSVKKC